MSACEEHRGASARDSAHANLPRLRPQRLKRLAKALLDVLSVAGPRVIAAEGVELPVRGGVKNHAPPDAVQLVRIAGCRVWKLNLYALPAVDQDERELVLAPAPLQQAVYLPDTSLVLLLVAASLDRDPQVPQCDRAVPVPAVPATGAVRRQQGR